MLLLCSEFEKFLPTTCASFVNIYPFIVSGIIQAQFLTLVYGILFRYEAINRYVFFSYLRLN